MGAWELKPKNLYNYLGKDNSHNWLWTLSKIFFGLSLLNHVWICFSWLLWQNSTAAMRIFYKFTFLHHGNCDVNLSPWLVAEIDLLLHVSRPSHSQKKSKLFFLWDILQTLREFYPKRDSQITKGGSVSICHCLIMVRSWGDIRTSLGFHRPIARYLIIGTQSNQVFSRFKGMLGQEKRRVSLMVNLLDSGSEGPGSRPVQVIVLFSCAKQC